MRAALTHQVKTHIYFISQVAMTLVCKLKKQAQIQIFKNEYFLLDISLIFAHLTDMLDRLV